jgi:toxin HigB-1
VRAYPAIAGGGSEPEDLNIAGFRFHGLQGNPKRRSMRVTANYRITFGWSGENELDIDFEDYH